MVLTAIEPKIYFRVLQDKERGNAPKLAKETHGDIRLVLKGTAHKLRNSHDVAERGGGDGNKKALEINGQGEERRKEGKGKHPSHRVGHENKGRGDGKAQDL